MQNWHELQTSGLLNLSQFIWLIIEKLFFFEKVMAVYETTRITVDIDGYKYTSKFTVSNNYEEQDKVISKQNLKGFQWWVV